MDSMDLFDLLKKNKYDEFFKIVTTQDIDVNIRDNSGNFLITYAIIKNNVNAIKLLLEKECRIDIYDQEGKTLLYLPIKFGYNEILKLILEYDKTNIGMSITELKDAHDDIPLHYAVMFRNIDAVKELIRFKSNPNMTNNENYNSLHIAVDNRDFNICEYLLERGANVNAQTNIGETALHIACGKKDFNIVQLLVKNNVNVNIVDYETEISAIFYSISMNDNKIAKYLLEQNIDLNIQDYIGNTILHYAIAEENNEIIDIITTNGKTNFNLYNIEGKIPLHILLEKSNVYNYNIKMFIKNSNLNHQDSLGNTPLHIICEKNIWENITEHLITKKLNIFIKNKNNIMPIDYIDSSKMNIFLKIVTKSYLFVLRNSNNIWKEEWENMCNKELFLNSLSKEDLQIIRKYVNEKPKNENIDVCDTIVNSKLRNIYSNIMESKDISNVIYPCDVVSYPQKANKKCHLLRENKMANLEFCTFVGITLDILIGLIYLLKKHDYACSTITSNFIRNTDLCNYFSNLGFKASSRCEFLNFEIVWVYKKLFFSNNFIENFNICFSKKNIRFIIIPLGIELENGSHANYIIYDKTTNEIERFEPYGFGSPYKFNYDSDGLDNILEFKFKEINENIKYVRPIDYLPKIGFQYFDVYESKTKKIGDPGGFCAVWSVWYTDLRLKYPEIPRKSLVKKLIREMKGVKMSFKNVIRNYSANITNIRDTILASSGITINDWINEQFNEDQFDIIIKEITKSLQ